MTGKLYGIGVGPGDPELITIKAVKALAKMPVVCVPKARAEQRSLALSIAEGYLSSETKIVELVMPMTEVQAELGRAWQEAGEAILSYLKDGFDVAFLTLGDPSLYSTFSYVAQALTNMEPSVEVEVIPGITSFAAAAARTGIPLAEGDEPLVILPTPEGLDNRNDLINQANLVLMKVSRGFNKILGELEKSHRLEGASLVSRIGQPQEFITRGLVSRADQKIDYLSLIISKKP